ncbi:MAG: hypothetical protein ACREBU_16095 [Nitrososphaera sp.]
MNIPTATELYAELLDDSRLTHDVFMAHLRAAVAAERERCCKAVCPKCAAGDKPVGGWHGGTNGAWRCPAAAIRNPNWHPGT